MGNCRHCKHYEEWFDDGWSYQTYKSCKLGHNLNNDSCDDFSEPTLKDELIEIAIRVVGIATVFLFVWLLSVLLQMKS